MQFNDLITLRGFKFVYETRSLTKASIAIGLSKGALGRRLAGLENDLGFPLFLRTTRSIVPTSEAHDFYSEVNEILSRLENLSTGISRRTHQEKRLIRITSSASLSHRVLGPLLSQYQEARPEIKIELLVTDSVLDPHEHSIDLALRINPNRSSDLIGKKLGIYKTVAVASDSYLKISRRVRKIEDLLHHKLLFLDQHANAFQGVTKALMNKLKERRIFLTNDSRLLTQLALHGQGIALRPKWDVHSFVQEKSLQLVLPEGHFRNEGEVWLLSRRDRLQSTSVRMLFDYLVKEIHSVLN